MIIFFYITRELIFPFLLTLGIISSILLMNQLYQLLPFLQATGLEIRTVLQTILYSLPPILMVASPISMLVSVYIGFNRISTDYELVVMRAAGISFSFLFRPVLFVSFLVTILVLVQTFYLSPIGVTKMEELKFSILKKQTKVNLSVRRINNFFGKKLIYIFEKKDDLLKGIVIADWEYAENSALIEAERGKIYLDETTQKIVFHLQDGRIHQQINKDSYRIINYKQLDYSFDSLSAQLDSPAEGQINKKPKRKNKRDAGWTIDELINQIRITPTDDNEYLDYIDEFHGRIVTILSSICFAFFALPLGIQDPRRPRTGSIVFLLASIIVYYYFFVQARSLFLQGKVPVITLYTPLILAIIVGGYNFLKINYNFESIGQLVMTRFRNRGSK